MKVFSEESALQLSEMLLQNDKDIKTEIEGKIPSIDGLASEKYVDDKVKNVEVNLDGYATEVYVNNAIANAQLGSGDTEVDLSGYVTKDDLKGYAKKEHTHDEYLTEHQDLSDYALKSEIPTDYLSSIPDEYVTETEMTEAINNAKLDGESIDLSDYAKKTDIPDTSNFVVKEDGKGLFSGSYDDLTDKPSIPEVYDDTDLDNRIKVIEDDYVKQADIPTTLPASDVYDWAKAETKPEYTADEVGALPSDTEIPSIDGLVSEDVLNTTLADYAKTTDVPSNKDILETITAENIETWNSGGVTDEQIKTAVDDYFSENPIDGSVDSIIDTTTIISNNVLKLEDVAETEKNGVTMTVVDEVITLNGTATANTDLNLNSNFIEDGTYTFAYEILEGTLVGNLKYGYRSSSYIEINTSGKASNIATHDRTKIHVTSGSVCSNLKIHLWAVAGVEYKEWQPYGNYTVRTLKEDITSEKIDDAMNNANIALEQSNNAKNSIDNFIATSDCYLGVLGNCYVKVNGETVEDSGFQTDKLRLKQGMKLTLNASGGSNVVNISRWDSTYSIMYSAICLSSDKSQQTWEYSAIDKEEYIAICGRTGADYKYEYFVKYEPMQIIQNNLINYIENVQYLNNFSAYFLSDMNGIAIGDSLTYGVVDGTTGSAKNTDKNYPYWLSKMLNCTIENNGHAGIDSLRYYDYYGSSKDYSNYDFALIFLGTNYGLEDNVADGANTTTQTGCYMKLIENILSQNSDCKIILVKPFVVTGDESEKTVNTKTITKKVIDEITEKYGLINVDLDVEPFNTTYVDGVVHQFDKTHLGVGAYLLMANKIAIGIGQALLNNISFMNDTY